MHEQAGRGLIIYIYIYMYNARRDERDIGRKDTVLYMQVKHIYC